MQTVLEVHDPYLDRGGRFELDGGAGRGRRAPRPIAGPDVSVDIDVLGGAYLGGGSPLRDYALGGRIDEHSPGALAALERALRTSRAPWATTGF